MKIRIYAPTEGEPQPPLVATVYLTDRRDQASWLPKEQSAKARFFLSRIETRFPGIEERIRSSLQREAVPVFKATSQQHATIRTRGSYSAREPHGTPMYWRAAIGLLAGETGLDYDQGDYAAMLAAMEGPAPVEPERAWRWHERFGEVLAPWVLPALAVVQVNLGKDASQSTIRCVPALDGGISGEVRVTQPQVVAVRGEGEMVVAEVQCSSLPGVCVEVCPAGTIRVQPQDDSQSLLVVLCPEEFSRSPDIQRANRSSGPALFRGVPNGSYLLSIHTESGQSTPVAAQSLDSLCVTIPIPPDVVGSEIHIHDGNCLLHRTVHAHEPELKLELPIGFWLASEPTTGWQHVFEVNPNAVDAQGDALRPLVRVEVPLNVIGQQIRLLDGNLDLVSRIPAKATTLTLMLSRGLRLVECDSGWKQFIAVR